MSLVREWSVGRSSALGAPQTRVKSTANGDVQAPGLGQRELQPVRVVGIDGTGQRLSQPR